MTFPKTPLPIKVELYYSAAWQDITADVNAIDGIQITRGRSSEGTSVDPASCSLTLKNTAGKYSPRNPNSPLYGLIGRNTPIRVNAQINGVWYQRFIGEVTAWPQRWGKKGATQSMAPIECSGILRRMGQGASPVRSTLYRGLSTLTDAVAYWPCEDGAGSSSIAAGRSGLLPGRVYGAPSLGQFDSIPASAPLPRMGAGRMFFSLPPYTTSYTNRDSVTRFVVNVPEGGLAAGTVLARIHTNSSLGWVEVCYDGAGGWFIELWTNDGVFAVASASLPSGLAGKTFRLSVELKQNGTGVDYTLVSVELGSLTGILLAGNRAGITLGNIKAVDLNPNRATLGDTALGHVTVQKGWPSVFDQAAALRANLGERATARITRLCAENGITFAAAYDDGTSPMLGYQGRETLLDLLSEAAGVGHGILVERRSWDGLYYRPLSSITPQTTATCSIPYSDNLLQPFEPVDDDDATRNKVTVTREGGASATVEETAGALGTQAPPLGVGVYDEAVTLSLAYDIDVQHHAGWRVHMGTVDEARYPQIGLDLAHPVFLADSTLTNNMLALSMGDRLDVTSLPSWLPPDPVQSVVQGYTETITPFSWKIVFNAAPFRPYRAGRYEDTGIVDRWTNSTTVLDEDLTTTEAPVDVAFTAGPVWTHADGDFDVLIGGERCTVTAVYGSFSPQTWTLTRSVNGVVKAHTRGTPVTLYDPTFYGLG